jgi:GST-like protein
MARLLRVLERRLGEAEYLAGDEYSIADIAVWPLRAAGVDPVLHPNTHRWSSEIAKRPAVIRGRDAERGVPAKYMQRRAALSPTEWSNMFGERMLGAVDL